MNERALAFAEFNAALNGVEQRRVPGRQLLRAGDGERFDLVVCNPPYVISPETSSVFRDSGLPGDTVSAKLVGELPVVPRGGRRSATIMISWIAGEDHDAAAARVARRAAAATPGSSTPATEDPLRGGAHRGTAASGARPTEYARAARRLARVLRRASASRRSRTAPSILHRRSGGGNWMRIGRAAPEPAATRRPGISCSSSRRRSSSPRRPGDALLDRRLALVEAARLRPHGAGRDADGGSETSADVRLAARDRLRRQPRPLRRGALAALDGTEPVRGRIAPARRPSSESRKPS